MKTAAVLTAALSLLGATASAAGIDPHDFEVNLQGGPQPEIAPTPQCTTAADGTMTCTAAGSYTSSAKHMTGTVRERSSGRSGAIETTCDFSMSHRQTVQIAPGGSPEMTEFGGSGSQRCSWHMSFPDGSLTGTLVGEMRMELAGPGRARFSGRMTVEVVAGTGAFADRVGTGTFEETEEFSLGSRSLAQALAARDGSRMSLRLRPGKPRARIASPGPRLAAGTDGGLRVVSAPGAACQASAVRAGRRVALGLARDADRDGLVVVTRKLRAKLTRGTWTLTASCAYRGGTAAVSATVVVG